MLKDIGPEVDKRSFKDQSDVKQNQIKGRLESCRNVSVQKRKTPLLSNGGF